VKKFTQDEMQAFAELMSTALSSPDGMQAIAAAVQPAILEQIQTKEIASLLYTRHVLPVGEIPRYQKVKEIEAFWVSDGGEAREFGIGKDEVEPPIERVHTEPVIDKSTLKHGNIGSLQDMQINAGLAIQKRIDQLAVQTMSAAVLGANTITCSGGKLTEVALNQALSILEDLELTPKWIVMRGARFNDIRSWTSLDNITQNELRTKGVLKNWGTASILTTSAAALAEILVIPEEEVGKMPVREELLVEPVNLVERFKAGFLAWSELGFCVTRPDLIVKINVTA
jgi:hypothetical protein